MFDRKMSRGEAEPNLIPVMNLFVALIPFLLLAVAFFHVGVIPTTLPVHQEGDPVGSRSAVSVTLVVHQDGMTLSAASPALSQSELASLRQEIPLADGQHDVARLRTHLESIKRRYQQSDTIIVLPADDVPFDEVVDVMDAARETVIEAEGEQRRVPLFPLVVLSRTV